MISVTPEGLRCVAAIGAHCDDIVIGAGATLTRIAEHNPDVVIHVLVFAGGGTEREIEEKNAFAALCPSIDVRLTVADLPDGLMSERSDRARQVLANFRRSCQPEVVFGPQRFDRHEDHRAIADLITSEFRSQLVLGYEMLKTHSDLPTPSVYLPVSAMTARHKADVLAQCYPSRADEEWFDGEAFLSLMRVRGVQCESRYAEAFVVEKAILDAAELCSLN